MTSDCPQGLKLFFYTLLQVTMRVDLASLNNYGSRVFFMVLGYSVLVA